MQFPVPQFLDVEDKIFGPFSLRQFIFLFVGGIIDAMLFKMFGFGLVFIVIGLPIIGLAAGISFATFNGKKLYMQIPVLINYLSAPKILMFHKTASVDNLDVKPITVERYKELTAKPEEKTEESPESKLKRLSRMLDQKREEEYEILNRDRNG
ncbi:hypothetical protein KGQ24_02600 [Patescibacteria group bacterium]|nr:hypothetical protein [Patescibacteria group bacterium]